MGRTGGEQHAEQHDGATDRSKMALHGAPLTRLDSCRSDRFELVTMCDGSLYQSPRTIQSASAGASAVGLAEIVARVRHDECAVGLGRYLHPIGLAVMRWRSGRRRAG